MVDFLRCLTSLAGGPRFFPDGHEALTAALGRDDLKTIKLNRAEFLADETLQIFFPRLIQRRGKGRAALWRPCSLPVMALALVGVFLSGGALRLSIARGFANTEPGAP